MIGEIKYENGLSLINCEIDNHFHYHKNYKVKEKIFTEFMVGTCNYDNILYLKSQNGW